MPIVNGAPEQEEMTADEVIWHLKVISTTQQTYRQDEAVKYAILILETLKKGLE